MKRKYLLLLSAFFLSSCDFSVVNDFLTSSEESLNESIDSKQTSIETTSEQAAEISQIESSDLNIQSEGIQSEVTSQEEISKEDKSIEFSFEEEEISSSEENSIETLSEENSSSEVKLIDVSDKEYYKSLVDRSKINYSSKLVNDPTHVVRNLEVFEVNDTHGAYIEQATGDISFTRVATCIKENTNDPYACVKIANGDMMQGSAFSNMLLGEPAVASLNELHFDCFVLGNHEFDWSLDNLGVYKDNDPSNGELECPILCANLKSTTGEIPSYIEPYTIVEKGDLRVGIIGIIGDGEEKDISKVSIGNYYFSDSVEAVNKWANYLQNIEHVNSIIVASHAHEIEYNEQYVSTYLVDAIINGHDHQSVEETVTRFDNKKVPVIESNTKNKYDGVGKITLTFDNNKKYSSYSMEHFDNILYYDEDTNLANILAQYSTVIDKYQNEVIGYTNSFLSKSDIGNIVCNKIAEEFDCDLVFINTGGVRNTIYKGDITIGTIYNVYPFDNELVIANVAGLELRKMIPSDSMDGYYYNTDREITNSATEYGYYSVNTSKTYKVCSVDYVSTKDYMTKYFNAEHGLINTGYYIRDLAIEAFRN